MKTTVDLPEDLLQRAKIAAVQRRTTLKDLFISGLNLAIKAEEENPIRQAAITRLKQGFHLGGQPLTRDKAHERFQVS